MAGTEVATQEQEQVAAEEAHAVATQIKAAMRDGRAALWRLAEALYEFNEMKGWEALGGYDNLSEWLADPEVGLTRSTYYRYVKTWEKLHVQRKIDPERLRALEPSKAGVVVPSIVAGKVPVDEALADVECLGFRDLREKYGTPKEQAKTPTGTSGQGPAPLAAEDIAEMTGDDLEALAEGADEDVHPDTRKLAKAELEQREAASITSGDEEAEQEQPEAEFKSAADMREEQEQSPEATSPSADALAEAEALPWDELTNSLRTGQAYPRLPQAVVQAFVEWHDKHLA